MDSVLGAILVAIITGGLSLVGVVITSSNGNRQIENQLITNQKVTDVKLDQLTMEVTKHNKFVEKVPVLEDRVLRLEQDVKDLKEDGHE
jgi:outer membrane murein-binding lipoprotein Lpp